MAPIEQRETKFVRKLLKMYNKGANINECYQYCCEHPSLLGMVEYEQQTVPYADMEPTVRHYKGAQFLHIHTIHHKLKLTFTGE